MATSVDQSLHNSHPRLLREGEVSPYKIMVSIILREYYTHLDLKPILPKKRMSIAFFFFRLISSEDMSYLKLISLCKEHRKILPVEVTVSFLRIMENLEESNPCFLNELVVSIIDMIDTSQTIILRKRVSKGSPVGKFLRMVMLNIRKMSYSQISYVYKQLWKSVKTERLKNLSGLVQANWAYILSKGFQKLYLQQHPAIPKGRPKPGLDSFNLMLWRRTLNGKSGIGPSLYGLPVMEKPSVAEEQSTPSKQIVNIKWHSRKIIERTIRHLCSEMYLTGAKSYPPEQVSNFLESIRHNPSSHAMVAQMHFLEYLNSIQLKDLSRSSDSLRTTFDLKIKPTSSDLNKAYAAYNFALLYDFLGFRKDALAALHEAFQASHACCDKLCLQYCNNLWASMKNIPYRGAVQESVKEIDKSMAYMHSFNVTFGAFGLHSEGKSPLETFQTIWKSTTSIDFEHTESLHLNALANLFAVLGDYKIVSVVSEVLVFTADRIKWPMRTYCSALLHLAFAALFEGSFDFVKKLMTDYGEPLFRYDGTISGEFFTKYHPVVEATRCFLGRKPVDEMLIATIRAFDQVEACYWSAYTRAVCKDWQQSHRLISYIWEMLRIKSWENHDMALRVLILEAEVRCAYGDPTGALQRLFEAHQLATRLSADFYTLLCQLNICNIQIFLGFYSTAKKALQMDTFVKCRSSCSFLRAKLCVVTAKLGLKESFVSSSTVASSSFPDMDPAEVCQLFKTNQGTDWSPKEPKRPKKSQGKVETEMEQGRDEETTKFWKKLKRLLIFSEKVYKKYGNDYLLLEALFLHRELLERRSDSENELRRLEEEISAIECCDPTLYITTCII